MNDAVVFVALVVGAYLFGSLSPSVFLGRLVKGVDVREHGSGNAGTTNAFRVLGKPLGVMVLIGDLLKGFLPALLATHVAGPVTVVFVAIAAIIGHNWSVFLRGKGGKGVATSAGTILAMMPLIVAALTATFLVVLAATSTVSLGSLTAALLFPILTVATGRPLPYMVFSVVASAVVIYAHRSNIKRLLQRREARVRLPWVSR